MPKIFIITDKPQILNKYFKIVKKMLQSAFIEKPVFGDQFIRLNFF